MANSYLDKEGLLYFLQKIRANATPSMDGTAATGTAKRFALQDHVHPSDTSKAPLASPALTGTPTAPTAATGTSTTQIATTEFVANAVGAMTSGVSDVKVGGTSVVTNGIANINGNETAASGGTTLSMVTTGEKYTWNNKASNSVFSAPQSQGSSGSKGLVPAPPTGSYNGRNTTVVTAGGDWSKLTLDAPSSQATGMQSIGLVFTKLSGGSTTITCTPEEATTSMNGFMSAADKTKLDGIASGAEVNQNAFSNVKVGSTTVAADAKTDTLELVAGSNVTLTPDATNDKVTIAATDTTYSNATTSTSGLMSSTDKSRLDSIYTNGLAASGSSTSGVSVATGGGGAYTLLDVNQKGVANGVCPLNSSSKIDSTYLPSYVDDVIEAYPRSGQTELSSTWLSTSSGGSALTPESGKIYVLMADSTSYSANSQFRWGGSAYVKLSDGGVSAITNAEIDVIVAS